MLSTADMNRRRWLSLSAAQQAQITQQVEAMRADVRLRKWSYATERCYCRWVWRYGLWLALSPAARQAADATARVTAFLRQLVDRPSPRSATTLKQALNVYGFSIDETLDSIKPEVVSNDGKTAKLKVGYTLLGTPLTGETDMVSVDGRSMR